MIKYNFVVKSRKSLTIRFLHPPDQNREDFFAPIVDGDAESLAP